VRVAIGTESGNLSVSIPSGNSAIGAMARYTKGGGVWSYAAANGADNTQGTGWSITGNSDPGMAGGDMVVVCSGVNGNGPTFTSHAIAQGGVIYGTASERVDAGTSNGEDSKVVMSDHRVTSGTSTGAPTYTMTGNESGANSPEGSSVLLRIR
jgi:hypothetical protein